MKKQLKIAGIGEILWDVLPEGKRLGGAPCNFAYHAQKLGADAIVVSAVGNDENGKEISDELNRKNITPEFIQINDKPTGTVDIVLDSAGVPNYTINENVAWDFIQFNEQIEKEITSLDIICFGSLAQRNNVSGSTIIKSLKKCHPNALIVFDINLRQHYYNKDIINESLKICNLLKLNEEELQILSDLLNIPGENEISKIQHLFKMYDLKLLAYTKGVDGSYLLSESEKSYLDTPKVDVKDTVGAGDSFTAAMVIGFANFNPLKSIHQKAVELSAFVCTQAGAMPEY